MVRISVVLPAEQAALIDAAIEAAARSISEEGASADVLPTPDEPAPRQGS